MNINQRGASMTRGNCLIATRRLSLGAAVLAVSVFSTGFVDAAIIAQLRPDFDNAAHVNEQSSGDADIADTLGTGTWRFYASITENPTDGGAGLFDLEYTTSAVSNRTANAYIHTAASQALGLPGISSGQLIDSAGQGTPASNEVAVHPGNQSDTTTKEFLVIRWTSGAGGTGPVNIAGSADILQTSVSGITFAIFDDAGSAIQASTDVGDPQFAFDIDTTVTNSGDDIWFVVGHDGDWANDQTGISATLSTIPEPSTIVLAVLGLLGMLGFRRRRIA